MYHWGCIVRIVWDMINIYRSDESMVSECLGMYRASFIVMALRAVWLMMWVGGRGICFPEMEVNITGWSCCSRVATHGNRHGGGGGASLAGMVTTGAHWMAGIQPGVLLCVFSWCVCLVLMRFCVAVGSLVCIIAGLFDTRSSIWGFGMVGILAGTLSSAAAGGGMIKASRWVGRFLKRAFPFGVVADFVVLFANLLVSAFKCSVGLRFGTWQCCRKSSAEPNKRYASVLGT